MKIPKHYSLVKEHPGSYEIHDSRDNSRFHIAKSGMDLQAHANLSKIPKYADGGQVGQTLGSIIGYPGSDKTAPKPKAVQNFDEGGEAEPTDIDYDSLPNGAPAESGPQVEAIPSTPEASAPAEQAQAPAQEDAAIPIATSPDHIPWDGRVTGSSAPSDPISNQATGAVSSLEKERTAIQGGAEAEAKASDQSANAYADFNKQADAIPTPMAIYERHRKADEDFMKAAMDKTVDPDRYWKNKSTGAKIASTIGLILGGLGSGITGGPNHALEMINKSIDRDIDAQKNEQGKAMNLWKMNREATQDETQATLATHNQLLNSVKAKILQFQAKAGGAMARARFAPTLQGIDQQINMNNFRRSLMESSQKGGGFIDADPAQLVPMMVQNPEQQKQVLDEIGRAQNVSQNAQKIKQYFEAAVKENTVLRTGAGLLRTPGSVMALHQLLLPNFKTIDGTVRQAAMDETYHNVTPAPGDSADKIAYRRSALDKWMHSETAAPIAKSAGLDLSRFSSTSANPIAALPPQQRTFATWALKHPNHPKAQMVITKLGLQ